MKRNVGMIGLMGLLAGGGGCTVVSANRVFPTVVWAWSADAKEQRREDALRKANAEAWRVRQRAATNSVGPSSQGKGKLRVGELRVEGPEGQRSTLNSQLSTLPPSTRLGDGPSPLLVRWELGETGLSNALVCAVWRGGSPGGPWVEWTNMAYRAGSNEVVAPRVGAAGFFRVSWRFRW